MKFSGTKQTDTRYWILDASEVRVDMLLFERSRELSSRQYVVV